jgi:hypothetical protein
MKSNHFSYLRSSDGMRLAVPFTSLVVTMQPCQSRAVTSVDAGERLLAVHYTPKIRGTLAFAATGGALLKENEQNKRNQNENDI